MLCLRWGAVWSSKMRTCTLSYQLKRLLPTSNRLTTAYRCWNPTFALDFAGQVFSAGSQGNLLKQAWRPAAFGTAALPEAHAPLPPCLLWGSGLRNTGDFLRFCRLSDTLVRAEEGKDLRGKASGTRLGWAGRAGPRWAGLGWARRESSELGRTGLQPGFGPPPAPRPAAGRSRSAPLTLRRSSGGAGAAHAQEAGRKRHTRHTGRRRQNRDQDGGARGEEGKLRVREARSAGSRVQVTVPQRRARARARGSPPVRPTALTADCLCFSSRSPSGGLCLRCLQPCAFRSSPGPLRSSGCPRRSPSQAAVPAARWASAPLWVSRPAVTGLSRRGSCLLPCLLPQQPATPHQGFC